MVLELFARLGLIVGLLVLLGLVAIAGWARVQSLLAHWPRRLLSIIPELGLLGVILVLNTLARRFGPDLSWLIGFEVTDPIYQLEGDVIVWIQSFAAPPFTIFFSRIYVYGYVFLLVFPLLLYLTLDDNRPLRTTVVAFGINYVIGLACYLLIIAYGPRNLLPQSVEPLLYANFPEYQELTRQVNRNTNVFPSLHASLSGTVALMAVRTRSVFPRWVPIAVALAVCVVISTMYLGIHWLTDVVAGLVLAVIAVWIAERIVARRGRSTPVADRLLDRFED